MWEIFSSFHSFFLFPFPRKRESPIFAAFGGEFAPLALESGDSRFRGNGGYIFVIFLFPPLLPHSLPSSIPAKAGISR